VVEEECGERIGKQVSVIGIVGSRRRNSDKDFRLVEAEFLRVFKSGDIICSGHCSRGGDRFAEVIAKKYKVETLLFPPNWKHYGRGAGLIRNTDVARESDILIACVAPDRTGGTEDTIRKYLRFGKTALRLVRSIFEQT
jgi:hypothetical protein